MDLRKSNHRESTSLLINIQFGFQMFKFNNFIEIALI